MLVPRTFRFDQYKFDPERGVDPALRIQSLRPVEKGAQTEIKKTSDPKLMPVLPGIRDLFKENEIQARSPLQRHLKVGSLWHPAEDPTLLKKPQKILVGIGDSGLTAQVVRAALKIAERYGSRLLITKIVPKEPEPTEVYKEKTEVEKILREVREEVAPDYFAKFSPELRLEIFSDPAEGLLHLARLENCSLIVLGSNPKTPSELLRQGAISGKVLKTASCPVLIWRQENPKNGWKRILVPIDGTPFSYQAIVQAIILCEDFGADLYLFHVSPDLQQKEKRHAQLKNLMQKMDWKNVRHDLVTRSGDTVETIVKFCRDQAMDMVVMGTHVSDSAAADSNPGITLEVAQKLSCPILVVHPPVS